jgi:hypothetical protein
MARIVDCIIAVPCTHLDESQNRCPSAWELGKSVDAVEQQQARVVTLQQCCHSLRHAQAVVLTFSGTVMITAVRPAKFLLLWLCCVPSCNH